MEGHEEDFMCRENHVVGDVLRGKREGVFAGCRSKAISVGACKKEKNFLLRRPLKKSIKYEGSQSSLSGEKSKETRKRSRNWKEEGVHSYLLVERHNPEGNFQIEKRGALLYKRKKKNRRGDKVMRFKIVILNRRIVPNTTPGSVTSKENSKEYLRREGQI